MAQIKSSATGGEQHSCALILESKRLAGWSAISKRWYEKWWCRSKSTKMYLTNLEASHTSISIFDQPQQCYDEDEDDESSTKNHHHHLYSTQLISWYISCSMLIYPNEPISSNSISEKCHSKMQDIRARTDAATTGFSQALHWCVMDILRVIHHHLFDKRVQRWVKLWCKWFLILTTWLK